MLKYHLLKARRKASAFLWTDLAVVLKHLAAAFDKWAYTVRTDSLTAFAVEHQRVGESLLNAAVEAEDSAHATAQALLAAAQAEADAVILRAYQRTLDAHSFLHDTKL